MLDYFIRKPSAVVTWTGLVAIAIFMPLGSAYHVSLGLQVASVIGTILFVGIPLTLLWTQQLERQVAARQGRSPRPLYEVIFVAESSIGEGSVPSTSPSSAPHAARLVVIPAIFLAFVSLGFFALSQGHRSTALAEFVAGIALCFPAAIALLWVRSRR
jgi:hypothetical protein